MYSFLLGSFILFSFPNVYVSCYGSLFTHIHCHIIYGIVSGQGVGHILQQTRNESSDERTQRWVYLIERARRARFVCIKESAFCDHCVSNYIINYHMFMQSAACLSS